MTPSTPPPDRDPDPQPGLPGRIEAALEHHRAGRIDAASELYREVLAREPENHLALHMLGVVAYQRGDLDRSARWIRQALALRPDDPDMHLNLGLTLAATGETSEALAAVRRGLALDDQSAPLHASLGTMLLDVASHEEAAVSLRRALELEPAFVEARINLGVALAAQGQQEAALVEYRQALRLDPTRADAHYNAGDAHRELGSTERAIEEYRRAVALDASHADARCSLGALLLDQGDSEAAIACFHEALGIDPHHADAHYNLGLAMHRADDLEAARASYERALEARGQHVGALYNLGRVHQAQEDFDQALALYRRVTAIEPTHAPALACSGDVLRTQGKHAAAIVYYRRALELDPGTPGAYIPLSAIHRSLGDERTAGGVLREGVRRHPVRVDTPTVDGPRLLLLCGIETSAYRLSHAGHLTLRGGFETEGFFRGVDIGRDVYHVWEDNLLDGTLDLEGYQLAINIIGDPDLEPAALRCLARFQEAHPELPLINDARQVLRTTRDENARRFAAHEGITFPATLIEPEKLALEHVRERMDEAGLRYPVLLREVGTHTGETFLMVHTDGELRSYCQEHAGAPVYVIAYHECRNRRGLFQKMRLFHIDGQLFPASLFLGEEWNLHNAASRALMLQHEWMMEEERRYLADPAGYLGAANYRALEGLRDEVRLDFYGVDFTLTPEGGALVFELNAAMYHDRDRSQELPYLEPYLQRGSDAFVAMVRKRLRPARESPPAPR